jgi:glycerol-3-phosphate acyltransferase PlsY
MALAVGRAHHIPSVAPSAWSSGRVIEALMSWQAWLAMAFGYLLGSIPFGLILTRAAGHGDVRKIGSGNIGATNVLRTGNKGLAAATLALDTLKATLAVFVVHAVLKSAWGFPFNHIAGAGVGVPGANAALKAFNIAALTGLAAFLGHIYPVWLGFKGGKGVATFIGALLGFFWPGAVFFCAVWLILAIAFRYSSAAALGASLIAGVYPLLLNEWGLGFVVLAMVALIFHKHASNIRRLLAGEEPKIGAKTA